MKTKKKTLAFSLDNGPTVSIPTSWEAMTDAQLYYICWLSASGDVTTEEIKERFFLRLAQWQGVKLSELDNFAVAFALSALDWLDELPNEPVRLSLMSDIVPVDAQLNGVPFREYLSLENYYQGYLTTQTEEALEACAKILYPGLNAKTTAAERYSVLLWLVGLHNLYAQLFPDLFRTSGEANSITDQREIMNAEIRALTGGDITKMKAVLKANTLDALTELNAKAREAREINEKSK